MKIGDRVRASKTAGFHKGARGVIVEPPTGQRDKTLDNQVWVLRDGASSPVWYGKSELELLCVRKDCTNDAGPDGPHCAHHYFTLPDADHRAGWEAEGKGGQGMKFDQDKPRMDLLDAYATEELAKVLTFGAKKYAPHNWRKGISYARLIAAALRHIYAFARGEDIDEETGLSHMAHAMCCCMFLVWMAKHRRDQDDRWKPAQPSMRELLERSVKCS